MFKVMINMLFISTTNYVQLRITEFEIVIFTFTYCNKYIFL